MSYKCEKSKANYEPNNSEEDRNAYFFLNQHLPPSVIKWVEEHHNDVFVICDSNGEIQHISQSVQRLLGYEPAQLYGTKWRDLVATDDIVYLEKHYNPITMKTQYFNLNLLHNEGKYIWTECAAGKVVGEDKKSIYHMVILRDISDKKEAEEMMIRSEKMSVAGQLAAGIAHEIRNPLTSIKGFLQLLQAGVNRTDEYYKIMLDEIEKIEAVTSELLFISKPLSDSKKIESVNQMIDDIVYLLRPQAKLRGIEINWKPEKDAHIICDRSQIKQVLINLVKNAIEAMSHEGVIQIILRIERSHIFIDISDEGPGIPPEIMHKLDEPFFTTKQNGTGLGLMITKQILNKHDGSLQILQNKQRGSTFRIILPKYNVS